MSKPFFCLKVELLSILLTKLKNTWIIQKECLSLQRQNESFDYAAECGEQALIDTTPFKSHPRVTFIFRISYELTCGIVD